MIESIGAIVVGFALGRALRAGGEAYSASQRAKRLDTDREAGQ